MPRKKLIDTNEIKIEKIDKDIVEKKDCLQVKLVFNKPLSEENMKVMREYFKISIASDNKTITRAVKNSWKGLVMLMLSLTFSKYRDEISNKVSNINSSVKDFKLWVDSNYEHIARMTRKYDKTAKRLIWIVYVWRVYQRHQWRRLFIFLIQTNRKERASLQKRKERTPSVGKIYLLTFRQISILSK